MLMRRSVYADTLPWLLFNVYLGFRHLRRACIRDIHTVKHCPKRQFPNDSSHLGVSADVVFCKRDGVLFWGTTLRTLLSNIIHLRQGNP